MRRNTLRLGQSILRATTKRSTVPARWHRRSPVAVTAGVRSRAALSGHRWISSSFANLNSAGGEEEGANRIEEDDNTEEEGTHKNEKTAGDAGEDATNNNAEDNNGDASSSSSSDAAAADAEPSAEEQLADMKTKYHSQL